MDVPDALERKVGPLPLGVWLLAIVGGVAAGIYLRRTGSGSGDQAADVDPLTGAPLGATQGAVIGAGGTTGNLSVPRPTTNDEWATAAVDALVRWGVSPLVATTAIARYLAGENLNPSEQAAVEKALQLVLSPPSLPPAPPPAGGSVDPSPTPPAPPPPPPSPAPVAVGNSAEYPRSIPGYPPAPDGMYSLEQTVQGVVIGVTYLPIPGGALDGGGRVSLGSRMGREEYTG